MRVTRFSAGPDGRSTFSEVEVGFPHQRADDFGHTILTSAWFSSPRVQFAELPAELDQGWHPAPQRQVVVILSGEVEVGTPDGGCRRFGPGDLFLADDVGTEGHTTRAVAGPVRVLFAPVPEGGEIWSTASPAPDGR